MSKELEALEFICKISKEKGFDIKWLFKEQYNTIKQRLEAIDNAKPSEAMKSLEKIKDSFGCDMTYYNLNLEYETVEQALLKSQEQEKVLEIIKEKNVCPRTLKDFIRRLIKDEFIIESYNAYVGKDRAITLEEFDLLKRCCE